jgi:hypothetical protein
MSDPFSSLGVRGALPLASQQGVHDTALASPDHPAFGAHVAIDIPPDPSVVSAQRNAGGLFGALKSLGVSLFEQVVGGALHVVNADLHNEIGDATVNICGDLKNDPARDSAVATMTGKLGGAISSAMRNLDALSPQQTLALTTLSDLFETSAVRSADGGQTLHTMQQAETALLLGAHFVIDDADVGAALYDQAAQSAQNPGATQPGEKIFTARESSHYPTTQNQGFPNYGIDLPNQVAHGDDRINMGHLLIGKTDEGKVFLQLEGHGVGEGSWLSHAADYGKHIGHGGLYTQIGPEGAIQASEKDNTHFVVTANQFASV